LEKRGLLNGAIPPCVAGGFLRGEDFGKRRPAGVIFFRARKKR